MKSIFCFILIMIACGANTMMQNKNLSAIQEDEDRILWNSARKLTWDDFKGMPPDKSKRFIYVAGVQTEIVFTKVEVINGLPKAEVANYFIKDKSWTVTDSILFLEHEQLHFDISEVYTRKIRRAFDSLNKKNVKDFSRYQKRYDELIEQSIKRDSIYDSEVYFNEERQKEWEEMIRLELEELKGYEYIPEE